MELVVATRSAHKMREIRRILADVPHLRVLDLDEASVVYDPAEEDLEPYDTFEANARSKAEYFHARTGKPTVADDSGLAVDALGGAPGVRSKRFAPDTGLDGQPRDDANNRHLVARLAGVPEDRRTARYVCVAVMVADGRDGIVTRGEAEGRIVEEPRGHGGFGYDPHFFDPELGRTFAEISEAEKNARSHRGRAFRALARRLQETR
ncbi:MAG: RdgB/HAM1 family non-canonical purine NTP pyrophosphatase [Longimicrobiales bacterium]